MGARLAAEHFSMLYALRLAASSVSMHATIKRTLSAGSAGRELPVVPVTITQQACAYTWAETMSATFRRRAVRTLLALCGLVRRLSTISATRTTLRAPDPDATGGAILRNGFQEGRKSTISPTPSVFKGSHHFLGGPHNPHNCQVEGSFSPNVQVSGPLVRNKPFKVPSARLRFEAVVKSFGTLFVSRKVLKKVENE